MSSVSPRIRLRMLSSFRRVWARVRAAARLIAIGLWTLPLFVVLLLVLPIDSFAPAAVHAGRRFLQITWARGVAAILGLHVVRHGDLPPRPYFLVSNHLSYVDIVALSTQLPCVFVAMAEIEGWPVMGYVAKKVGTIFINRQNLRDTKRVNDAVSEMLDAGEGVLIFAESTTSAGNGVLPFKPALFETPARRGMPVHYAAIHYTVPAPWPPPSQSVCWVDDTPFFTHGLRVLQLPRYTATIDFGPQALEGINRRALAQTTQDHVESMLRPMK